MKIKAQLGKNGKIHIYADGEYSFSVSPDLWYKSGLNDGDEIEEENFENFRHEANFEYLFDRALDILSRRDHSRKELELKLRRYRLNEQVEKVIDKVSYLGLIDDENFAQKFAAELYRRKGFSFKRIKQELLLKGIERDTAESIADSYEAYEQDSLVELINRKFMYAFDGEKDLQRAVRALQRLGYSYSDVMRAFETINEDFE